MSSFGTENRRLESDLSPEARAAIISAPESGQSPTSFARQFHVSRNTIYRTKQSFESTKSLKTKKQSGRPTRLSQSEQRYICLLARRRPGMTWKGLMAIQPRRSRNRQFDALCGDPSPETKEQGSRLASATYVTVTGGGIASSCALTEE